MFLDATVPGFIPWWERASRVELERGLRRMRRALSFCRGRAADLRPILVRHIRRLEILGNRRTQ